MATIERGTKNYHPNSGPRRADNLDDDGETIGSKWGVPGAPRDVPQSESSSGTPKKVPKKDQGTPEKVPRKNRRKRKGLLDLLFD